MALDQGTTSSRTILFSEKGEIIADSNVLFRATKSWYQGLVIKRHEAQIEKKICYLGEVSLKRRMCITWRRYIQQQEVKRLVRKIFIN